MALSVGCGKAEQPAQTPEAKPSEIQAIPQPEGAPLRVNAAENPDAIPAAPIAKAAVPQSELDKPAVSGKKPLIEFATNFFVMPVQEAPEPVVTISGTPLPRSEVARVREVLESELARYPAGSLADFSTIFVFNTLAINNKPAGGTYLPGLVFIAAGELPPGPARDARVARALHHEFSSVFFNLNQQLFDKARFRVELPNGFVYPDELPGAPYVQEYIGADSIPSFADFGDGFLVPYGRRKFEQDFNSYAEILLWRPELLLKVFAPESRVGRKARVVRDFYIAIDKRFEAMFNVDEK